MSTAAVLRTSRGLTGVMLALLLLLNGCALTFGYRHADWLIRWQLDHYLDLTSGQRRDVTTRLQPLLLRHRREALPQYEQFLKELQQRISRGLSREDVDWTFATYDRFRADLFERTVPDAGALLTQLNPKQVQHLGKVFLKEETKAARVLQGPTAGRLEERTRKGMVMAEEWLGPLAPEQSTRVRALIVALPDSQPVWWQFRQQRHEELLALLRSPATVDQISHTLQRLFVHSDQSAPAGYLKMVTEMRAALTKLVLETDRMMTPLQRRHVLLSLQNVIEELHALAPPS